MFSSGAEIASEYTFLIDARTILVFPMNMKSIQFGFELKSRPEYDWQGNAKCIPTAPVKINRPTAVHAKLYSKDYIYLLGALNTMRYCH
jgi:hypothetical protein